MKKLDVLLMLLSGLFPVAGIMKQIPLPLSLILGGLLFFTSFGSYYTKQTSSRVCSWLAYTIFITFLMGIWDQYVTMSSLLANAKIAACIALLPAILCFRTYGITFGLLALWGALLWDVKEVQSLAVLGRMMNLLTTEKMYLLLLIAGFLVGGLFANGFRRKNDKFKQETPNVLKQKKKRMRPTFHIRIPRLPKLRMKMLTFGRTPTQSKDKRPYESMREENIHAIQQEPQHEQQEPTTLGQTRMERRRNRYHV
ncbi:DUF3959 family protein [Bacillus cytotoxicus]|uniref:DUF3959 domain-containing protein n=2 Tax=Bacillus cytotoxicus TaxID=580165 RepID=A0AAX2CH06_9BACI|nr:MULTISPECIES: DUF3959 family protein [Bacillus cereus group]ABS22177.1 conserved hypothetical protein [Bacillus cytotoxicus NVH 391-98]AWC28797.1 DUF3959 domain-containing protein [Bacillus cytotoxicus]AWC32803.1 DUF3959 domain-containing protein [Bacillus cytotoxicus]AWC36830.1 DUF3959 domain-containing protein [Bacillus cytotoxicus]AWC39820.1 DUF3959 domain-containing protein [Bacillus cytotoxicus]